ncbi:unnamed protein product [Peronospora destructor]|uniref:Secreted protein n=1 Tax=Peronospora destructor TaxID=86335 RepID=A0AAV0U3U6_9STRA|nr:unnamed protein product [Peronospora destructor]
MHQPTPMLLEQRLVLVQLLRIGVAVLMRVLRISADRGFVQDVKCFVVGLLLSLVPAWHPQPIQGAVPMRGNAMPDNMPMQEI